MNYAQLRPMDVANGPGIRVSLFVSGCTHRCPQCFNALYQDFDYGQPWGPEIEAQLLAALKNPLVSGLSLLGGEPMQNLWLGPVLDRVYAQLGPFQDQRPIWLYSGYTYEQILEDPERLDLLRRCAVLVDGLYVEALRDLKLRFRGSSNQRLIDVPASLAGGRVQLWQP